MKRLIARLLGSKIGSFKTDLQSIHNLYLLKSSENTSALDLGCGLAPQNRFKAKEIIGVDLIENKERNVIKCKLWYEILPFANDSFDYLTDYDLIEHIPRFSETSENGPPFIFFMNECFRVLKPSGIFLSMTPIYPYFGAFQDPTHNNIITVDTFKLYFSEHKNEIASHYGITSNFKILEQKMYGQHLIAVMTK